MTGYISIDALAWIIRIALALAVSCSSAWLVGYWLDLED